MYDEIGEFHHTTVKCDTDMFKGGPVIFQCATDIMTHFYY
jgi:hypothetical protein